MEGSELHCTARSDIGKRLVVIVGQLPTMVSGAGSHKPEGARTRPGKEEERNPWGDEKASLCSL